MTSAELISTRKCQARGVTQVARGKTSQELHIPGEAARVTKVGHAGMGQRRLWATMGGPRRAGRGLHRESPVTSKDRVTFLEPRVEGNQDVSHSSRESRSTDSLIM